MRVIKIAEAKALTGGLSNTTKMPCPSWSIPVSACRTGQKMMKVAGSACSKCYADKGNYRRYQKTLLPAQTRRLELYHGDQWVDAMVALVGNELYFRWFDSGDLQEGMLAKIAEVARRTPNTHHWLPTREYGEVISYVRNNTPRNGGALPSNLTIRLSDLFIDRATPMPAALRGIPNIVRSSIHSKHSAKAGDTSFLCGAYEREGKCGTCRACWSKEVACVSYPQH